MKYSDIIDRMTKRAAYHDSGIAGIQSGNGRAAAKDWLPGKYETLPGPPQRYNGQELPKAYSPYPRGTVRYTRPDGTQLHITPDMRALHSNSINAGLGVDKLNTMDTNSIMSAYTGIPNYTQQWNNYWASIPNGAWNKVFKPATPQQRQSYRWNTPEIHSTVMGADDNARYNSGGGGKVVVPDVNGASITLPSYYSEVLGGGDYRTFEAGAFSDPRDNLPTVAHELTHANQIEQDGNWNDYTGWQAFVGNNSHPVAWDKWNTPINERPYPVKLPKMKRLADYTGNKLESLQMIHSLKDGIMAQQKLIKEHPERFSQFKKEDIDALMGINPWFRSSKEMQKAMLTLRQHPEIAITLGSEPIRALDTAQDYDNYYDAVKEAERNGIKKFSPSIEVKSARKRFYDCYMANAQKQQQPRQNTAAAAPVQQPAVMT